MISQWVYNEHYRLHECKTNTNLLWRKFEDLEESKAQFLMVLETIQS